MKKILLFTLCLAAFVLVSCSPDDSKGKKKTPPPPAVVNGTIEITSPTATTIFIYKGQTQAFTAVVKDSDGVEIPNATVTWSASATTAGTFSVNPSTTSTSTVFTAGSNNFNGKITAEYNGNKATINVIIGEADEIVLTCATPAVVKGGAITQISAVVKANGHILSPQPTVNWTSANTAFALLNRATGPNVNVIPKTNIGNVNITAKVNGTPAINTIVITVKDKYFLFNDNTNTISLAANMSKKQGSFMVVNFVTGGLGYDVDPANYMQVQYPASEPDSYFGINLPSPQDLSGYTKVCFYAKGNAPGQTLSVYFGGLSATANAVSISYSPQYHLYTFAIDSSVNMKSVTKTLYISRPGTPAANYKLDIDYIYLQ